MESVLDVAAKFKGTVDTEEDLRVDGFLEGEIRCSGRVLVAQGGKVVGEITAVTVEVAGIVEGDVKASGLLLLTQTGRITGDVRVGHIRVEDGGVLQGRVLTESEASPGKKG